MNINNHIEGSLGRIREIFLKASTRIEALKVGQKIPATVLASELGEEYGMTGPQLYPILKYLFDGYPGIEVKRGAHGGIVRIMPSNTAVTQTSTEIVTMLKETESESIQQITPPNNEDLQEEFWKEEESISSGGVVFEEEEAPVFSWSSEEKKVLPIINT